MLSHNWLPTDQPTNQLSDQMLELLEWLFATKKIVFLCYTYKEYSRIFLIEKFFPDKLFPRAEVSDCCRIVDDSELPSRKYTLPSQSTLTSHHQLIQDKINITYKTTLDWHRVILQLYVKLE